MCRTRIFYIMVICTTYTNLFLKKALLINVCLFIKATKKKAWKKRKEKQTGRGPAPPHYTQAEELALGLNVHLPIVEGIPGFSFSSDPQPEARSSNTFTAGK